MPKRDHSPKRNRQHRPDLSGLGDPASLPAPFPAELPDGWTVARLGDVVTVHDKLRVPLNEFERQEMKGIYPYYGANGLVDLINQYTFDGEYLLLAEDGGHWGRNETSSYVVNGRFWVNNHAHVLRALDGVTTNLFLSYALNYLDIVPFISGDARGKLTQAVMKTIVIPLPPLSEQRAIARVLSTIQRAIETQDRLIAAARALKRALMRHLFTYGAVPPAQAERVPLKQTEIGAVPEGWEVVHVARIAEVKGGKRVPKGHKFADNPTPYPYIRVVDLKNGSAGTTNLKFLNPEDHEAIKRYTISSEDVYISIAGTIGLIGIIPKELDGANLTENAAKIVFRDRTKTDKQYIAYFLSSERGQSQIAARVAKTSQPKLALARIRQIPILLPPIAEQRAIARILAAVDKKIAAEEKRKAALQTLFKTMLHELMTGRIRVNAADSRSAAHQVEAR